MNAMDMLPDARDGWRKTETEALEHLGFHVEELDLRNYFADQSRLQAFLETKDMLWINGGNSFLLRRAMRQSGFDVTIHGLLQADRIVYAGFSAAVCCAGPTLHGVEFLDRTDELADGYDPAVIWEGLHLVDRTVVVHYNSRHSGPLNAEQMVQQCRENRIPFTTLSDGQVLIVDGVKTELLE
jgi:dipeptidase E